MSQVVELSSTPFQTKKIAIGDQYYDVDISETGDFPVVCYGLGSLMRNTFSERFKGYFKVYSSDFYWDEKTELKKPETTLTMERLVDDFINMIDQLEFEEYIVCGHSTFGIVALEIAKYDPRVKGVIMVGSPPNWNQETWSASQQYFAKFVDTDRKANFKQRLAVYEQVKVPGENECSINAYIRDTPRYWKNYAHSDEFLKSVWGTTVASNDMMNCFFDVILPAHDYQNKIKNITVPVIVVGGVYDFDCLPLKLWSNAVQPSIFTLVECAQSGHWPNLEEPDVFDRAVIEWHKAVHAHSE